MFTDRYDILHVQSFLLHKPNEKCREDIRRGTIYAYAGVYIIVYCTLMVLLRMALNTYMLASFFLPSSLIDYG